MAIPAVALLQQHDARRDILIEPAARRRAAIEARGHLELEAQSGCKNQPACYRCLSVGECCHLCEQNHVLYVEHYTFDTVAAQQVPTAIRSTAASIPRPLGRLLHVQMTVC